MLMKEVENPAKQEEEEESERRSAEYENFAGVLWMRAISQKPMSEMFHISLQEQQILRNVPTVVASKETYAKWVDYYDHLLTKTMDIPEIWQGLWEALRCIC
jgi:hypothetical protein